MQRPAIFSELFATQPDLVRNLLRSALHLDRLDSVYQQARSSGINPLASSVLDVLKIRVDVSRRDLHHVPQSGPFIVVANHPHGFLDGLALDDVLSRCRSDVKIIANHLVGRLEENLERCIPIDVLTAGRPEKNITAVRQVLDWLRAGHGIAMFPAGEVSHWQPGTRQVADGPWNDFAVRCARKTNASIIPMYFVGGNSLTFQMAGMVHASLRTARLPAELLRKRTSSVELRVGRMIRPSELLPAGPVEAATNYVRARVYMLGQRKPHNIVERPSAAFAPASPAAPTQSVSLSAPRRSPADEIASLARNGACIAENERLAVYRAVGADIPALLEQLGRARETTFRAVGEGTGKSLDLDSFDRYYTQLILWDKREEAIAGGYRLAWTNDVLPRRGISGLYTSKLFRYSPGFFSHIGPAVELGRSFVTQPHQKDYASLFLLWQAISRCVARRSESPTLFGAVSISTSYSEPARELIVNFLRERSFDQGLSRLAIPRRAFRSKLVRKHDIELITRSFASIEDLPLSDLEVDAGIPVLLRQYLRLGGRVAAFNVDTQFSYALDALLILDVRNAPRNSLSKYMGAELSRAFLEGVDHPPAAIRFVP